MIESPSYCDCTVRRLPAPTPGGTVTIISCIGAAIGRATGGGGGACTCAAPSLGVPQTSHVWRSGWFSKVHAEQAHIAVGEGRHAGCEAFGVCGTPREGAAHVQAPR